MTLKVTPLAWRRAQHELDAVRAANGEIPAEAGSGEVMRLLRP